MIFYATFARNISVKRDGATIDEKKIKDSNNDIETIAPHPMDLGPSIMKSIVVLEISMGALPQNWHVLAHRDLTHFSYLWSWQAPKEA